MLALLVCTLGCSKTGDVGGATAAPEPSRRVLDVPVAGISGASRDEAGVLWLVPERDRVLVALEPSGSVRMSPVEGVPEGLDLESVACLGDGRFVLGTEPNAIEADARTTIYFARRDGERVVVTEALEIDPTMWEMTMRHNEGVEGLCRAGGFLVAGIETVIERDGQRYAPIGLYDLGRERWQALRLPLTTATGKLSALACRTRGAAVEVTAVERHFGVARLLRFQVRDGDTAITARVVTNLDAFVAETALNFEGLELGEDGDVVLAVDNQWKGISGPNELVTFEGAAP